MTRAQMMANIRGADTLPERAVRRALWATGLRYRKNVRVDGVRADIVFRKSQVLVFLDGCFWHGCPKHFVLARRNRGFWLTKLRENVSRDRQQTIWLESRGWRVLRYWEHDVADRLGEIVTSIMDAVAHPRRTRRKRQWRIADIEILSDGRERRRLEDLQAPDVCKFVIR